MRYLSYIIKAVEPPEADRFNRYPGLQSYIAHDGHRELQTCFIAVFDVILCFLLRFGRIFDLLPYHNAAAAFYSGIVAADDEFLCLSVPPFDRTPADPAGGFVADVIRGYVAAVDLDGRSGVQYLVQRVEYQRIALQSADAPRFVRHAIDKPQSGFLL